MLSQEQFLRFSRALPIFESSDTPLAREFQSMAYFASIPAGKDVFVEGEQAESIALLVSGVVRVYKIGETGREITLYRFGHGESCILTANAILSRKSFPAIATVEKDAEAVMIPADVFRDWVKRHDLWREFVFDLLSDRLSSVLTVVDEVVFQRMDRRVAALLLNKSQTQHPVRITHQEIAAELGSSREVISRILEDLSQRGLIESGRGTIEILDFNGIEIKAVV
ncbi:MAG: Crp/Fnr family transcriptional regulator [Chloroflexi bacterium]|nr:MAG: Crp/Fnr family transcriptional regulator [Chloroflexota bacterium]